MDIYVQKDGQRLGPFPEAKIRQGIDAGDFGPDDLAWTNGKASWQPLSALINLDVNLPPPVEVQEHPNSKLDASFKQKTEATVVGGNEVSSPYLTATTPFPSHSSSNLTRGTWQERKPLLRVLRDILILVLFSAVGGVISALIQNFVLFSQSIIPLLICNVLSMVVAFAIIAASRPIPKFRHLLYVASGSWLFSFINVVFFGFSIIDWATGTLGWIMATMVVGWAIAKLLRRREGGKPKAEGIDTPSMTEKVKPKGSAVQLSLSIVGVVFFLILQGLNYYNSNAHPSTNPYARTNTQSHYTSENKSSRSGKSLSLDKSYEMFPSANNRDVYPSSSHPTPSYIPGFVGLRSSEGAFQARYGQPFLRAGCDLKPADFREAFQYNGMSITVLFWKSQAHSIIVARNDDLPMTSENISFALTSFSEKEWITNTSPGEQRASEWSQEGASASFVQRPSDESKPDVPTDAVALTTDEFVAESKRLDGNR